MKLKYVLAASVAALISSSAVQAADVLRPKVVVASNLDSFSWAGSYLGLQGSYSNLSQPHSKFVLNAEQKESPEVKGSYTFTSDKLSLSAAKLGLFGGYNAVLSNNLVVGLELGANYNFSANQVAGITDKKVKPEDIKKPDGTPATFDPALKEASVKSADRKLDLNFDASLRLRAGMALGKVLPFVALGVNTMRMTETTQVAGDAFGDAKAAANSGYGKATTANKWMMGWTAGLGVDVAVTDKLMLRAEYNYSNTNLSKKEHTNNYKYTVPKATKEAENVTLSYSTAPSAAAHDVRIGLGMKF